MFKLFIQDIIILFINYVYVSLELFLCVFNVFKLF